jgi:chemotaxis response regulator CheB
MPVHYDSRIAFADKKRRSRRPWEIREFVRRVLNRPPEWELVGEAGDGIVAVEVVKQLQLDIVIMDVQMPRLDGIKLSSGLRRMCRSLE